MSKGQKTRERILAVAQEAVLAKGFDATSIDEIVAATEITKSGFFYHYRDKNALARALLERYIAEENRLFDDIFRRAGELDSDPLHKMLIGLKMLAEMLEDLPSGHPGCLVASVCYQDRLFDRQVQELNRSALLAWRNRFTIMFREIATAYPPREPVKIEALADMFSGVIEGGIILARAMKQPDAIAAQLLHFRTYIRLLFQPRLQ